MAGFKRVDGSEVWPRRWLLTLTCGCHTSVLEVDRPAPGDDKHCYVHGTAECISTVSTEFNVKCLDCSSRKGFGRAKYQAQLFADKHHRSKPTHRVQLRDGLDVIEIRVPKLLMQELDFPPF